MHSASRMFATRVIPVLANVCIPHKCDTQRALCCALGRWHFSVRSASHLHNPSLSPTSYVLRPSDPLPPLPCPNTLGIPVQIQWRFVNRAIDGVENGSVPAVVLVTRASTDTQYYSRLLPYPRILLRRGVVIFKASQL